MIILVSGATKALRNHPEAGVLLTPRNRQYHVGDGRPYGVDNGAFSGFDGDAFLRLLDRLHAERKMAGCLFVVAPDVVGNALATQALFAEWEPRMRPYGFPIGFVLQDGQTDAAMPWDRCQAVFVGGTTEYKLGRDAAGLVALAKMRGKWVHMGRVNTRRRIRYALQIGVDSIDGTTFSRWPDAYMGKGLGWIDQLKQQRSLDL